MKNLLTKMGRPATVVCMVLFLYSCQQEDLKEIKADGTQHPNFVSVDQATAMATIIEFPLPSGPKYDNLRASGVKSTYKDVESVFSVPGQNGAPTFYIINYKDDGYIMISGDNRTEPIKSFSPFNKFSFTEESYPSELVYWLIGTNDEINQIRELDPEQSEAIAQLWLPCEVQPIVALAAGPTPIGGDDCDPGGGCEDTHVSYGPHLTTTWGQWDAYNDQAPNLGCGGDGRAPTGCVATAMAQVMNYHEFPTNYVWANMPDNSGTAETARLMRDIGDAVNMDYGCDGSGADTKGETASSFKVDFGYSSANFADYNHTTAKAEIRAGRPIILRGGRNNKKCFLGICIGNYADGHAWVCDGYRSSTFCETGSTYTYLHMNWGWNGASNGYYAYNNWNPAGFTFNYKKGMVYNIRP